MVRGIFYKTTIKHKYAYRRIYPLEETYVNWVPSIGYFDKHERDFIPEDSIDEDEEDIWDDEDVDVNEFEEV